MTGSNQGGGEGLFPFLQVSAYIFYDHNGVINHKAGGNDHGHKCQVVQGIISQVHYAKSAHQG